jgi:hypothetical protein
MKQEEKMHHGCGGMPAEGERDQQQHLDTGSQTRKHIGRDGKEAPIIAIPADQAEVIACAIGG